MPCLPLNQQCQSTEGNTIPISTVKQKRNHFSFRNKSFSTQCNLTKFSTLVLMNIIIDLTYLISGIYTNFCRLLCKKCDVGYYVINHGVNEIDYYRLVFIVSILLLCKILNTCQNKIHRIVACTFLNICEINCQFLSSIKKMHRKERWLLFQLCRTVVFSV